MAKRKPDTTTEPDKEYTFDEYLRTFLPQSHPKRSTDKEESEGLGKRLAEKALRRIREALQQA